MFEFARIYNLHKNNLVKTLKIFIFVVLLWFVYKNSINGYFLSQESRLAIFGLSVFLMFEVFFYFKIVRASPSLLVKDNGRENIYDSFTLKALSTFIASKNSKNIIKNLLTKPQIKFILQKADSGEKDIKLLEIPKESLGKYAFETAKKLNGKFVTTMDLFTSYLLLTEHQTNLLFNKKLKKEEFVDILFWARNSYVNEERVMPIRVEFWGEGVAESWVSGWTLETQKYMVDMTPRILKKKSMLLGRSEEYREIVSALSNNKSVILVGEPGSGKNNLVETLALESFLGNLEGKLYHQRFHELLADTLLAGTQNQGELESRLDNVIAEIAHSGRIIVFVPKVENILGATTFNTDLSGTLIPYLQKGIIRIIATVTPSSYKKFVESKHTFLDTFQIVRLSDPDKDTSLKMLLQKVPEIEREKQIVISYRAIIAAFKFASKYSQDRAMPGQPVLLLEDTADVLSVSKKKIMEEQDVIDRIESKTKIAVGIPKAKEKELLLHLEDEFHKRIIDQKEAVFGVSEALRRLRVGLSTKEKPISFLFLGPTGVGKTETAKALSAIYFGSESNMIRLDMSEYSNEEGVRRLLGGVIEAKGLTDMVYEEPFSLILLDEFEKSSPKVIDLFLQVLDDGRLTDNNGKTVSFVDTIIIATSNAASEYIREEVKKGTKIDKNFQKNLLDFLQEKGIFRPELLNRFDEVVVFEPLGKNEVYQITKLLLTELSKKLLEKDITVSFNEKITEKISQEGLDEQFGARPLRRFMQDTIEDQIAQKILKEEIKRGDKINLSVDEANNLQVIKT